MIKTPGKFEGEADYVPSLWEDSSGNPVAIEIGRQDVETWPELDGVRFVYLWEDSQGFVRQISEAEYLALLQEIEDVNE